MKIFTNMSLEDLCIRTSQALRRELTEEEILRLIDILEYAEDLGEEDD